MRTFSEGVQSEPLSRSRRPASSNKNQYGSEFATLLRFDRQTWSMRVSIALESCSL